MATLIAMKGTQGEKNNAWEEQIWQAFKVKDLTYDDNAGWTKDFQAAAALIPTP